MNYIQYNENTDIMNYYIKTENIVSDMQRIIDNSQEKAYQLVNKALLQRNWLIGYRIAEEELQGESRAEYGAEVIKKLSKELTNIYGKGFTKSNLYSFYSLYKCFPEIFHAASGKLGAMLSWTHYRCLIQFCMVTSNFLHRNISCIFLRNKN